MKTNKHQQNFAALIDEKLSGLAFPEEPRLLYEPARYTLSLGGKRIRPYLTVCGCGLCGGKEEEAVPAALAVELLHNFTLIHDDIMDGAETRRGHPSVYKKWNISTAILSGDVIYAWAFQQLQYYGINDRFDKQRYAQILKIFTDSARQVCEGQAFDLDFEHREPVTLNHYLDMIRGKTAALISGALKMGGAVGGATEEQMNCLEEAGISLGLAFQIQDDLLDAVADSEKFGKIRGGDIKEGKKTFLSILSLQEAEGSDENFLKEVFDKGRVEEEEIDRVISIYQKLEILEEAQYRIDHYYSLAVDQIERFSENEYKLHLKELLKNLLNREY